MVVHCAKVVTECFGSKALETPREIVDTFPDPATADAFARFMKALETYEDSTSTLPGISMNKKALADMVQANAQITSVTAAAQAAGAATPALGTPPPLPVLENTRPSASAAEPPGEAPQGPVAGPRRECPECGESISATARKCRFCGIRLDQPPGAQPGENQPARNARESTQPHESQAQPHEPPPPAG
jgi:hypothetical protein